MFQWFFRAQFVHRMFKKKKNISCSMFSGLPAPTLNESSEGTFFFLIILNSRIESCLYIHHVTAFPSQPNGLPYSALRYFTSRVCQHSHEFPLLMGVWPVIRPSQSRRARGKLEIKNCFQGEAQPRETPGSGPHCRGIHSETGPEEGLRAVFQLLHVTFRSMVAGGELRIAVTFRQT